MKLLLECGCKMTLTGSRVSILGSSWWHHFFGGRGVSLDVHSLAQLPVPSRCEAVRSSASVPAPMPPPACLYHRDGLGLQTVRQNKSFLP